MYKISIKYLPSKININFVKKSKYNLRKAKKENYGLYYSGRYFKNQCIELYTQQFRSTIKTLIHEIHHQILDELIDFNVCCQYDNIYQEFEKYIFS